MRFHVGETARFMFAMTARGYPYQGMLVDVIEVSPDAMMGGMHIPLRVDYRVRAQDGKEGFCMDYQLAKFPAQPEPRALKRTENVQHE